MKITVIDKVTNPGLLSKANEDLIVISDGLFVTLDGATGLGGQLIPSFSSDALWFVEAFSKYLVEIWQNERRFLKAIEGAIDACIVEYSEHTSLKDQQDYQLPSAGMVAIAIEDDLVRTFRLGDCTAYYANDYMAYNLFKPSPLEDLDARAIKAMTLEISNGKTLEQARKAIMPILRTHRSLMNKPDGYGALSLTHECLKHIETTLAPTTNHSTLLLATDGFSAIEKYKNYTVKDLLTNCLEQGLSDMVNEIREIENNDLALIRHPRLKPHDDATALLIGIHQHD